MVISYYLILIQVQAVQARALYSKAEEELLGSIKSNSNPTLQTFETHLRENPHIFFSARTPKALLAHWSLLKQYHLLPDQTVPPLTKSGPIKDFSEAEQQVNKMRHKFITLFFILQNK